MNIQPDSPPVALPDDVSLPDVPSGVDRRSFLMRSAVISAAALVTGRTLTPEARAQAAAAPASKPQVPLSSSLNVVKESKGPVMTTVEEFYK